VVKPLTTLTYPAPSVSGVNGTALTVAAGDVCRINPQRTQRGMFASYLALILRQGEDSL
jgi:hypothetical protein